MKKPVLPEWYWHAGMHDSAITDIEIFEFPFDDGKFRKEKRKDDRNMLKLTIDTEASLGDPDVREIHFYNFKILSPYRKLRKGSEFWWLSDTLKGSEGHFSLEIKLQNFDEQPQDFTFKIEFERSVVMRSQE